MLKNSKTTIRELTKRYRVVLIAGVIASSFVTTSAGAVEVNLADGSSTADVATTETLNNAVSTITGSINTINGSINTEIQKRTEADVELDGKITANQNAIAQNAADITNLQAANTGLGTQITDNTNAISQHTADIGNLKDADIELQDNINTVNTRVDSVVNGVTTNEQAIADLKTVVGDATNGLVADITNLQAANTGLGTQITDNTNAISQHTADIGNLKDADIELQGNIDTVNTRVDGVVNRVTTNETAIAGLKTADTTLQGSIDAVQDNLDTEAQTRADADTTLQDNLDTEAQTRADADATLQGKIDAEAQARSDADATLQGKIDAVQDNLDTEAQTRSDADATLQGSIDAVQNNLNTEAQTRADADATLQGNIDVLSGRVGDITTLKTTQKDTVVGAINEVVDNITVVDGSYNHVTQGAGVADNLVALDSAIGTTADGNYVQSTKTIGQNLNALDSKIGVVSNGAQVSGSQTIAQNINALDNAIGNRTIASENEAINDALKTNVAAAFTATGNAIGDMNFENTRYVGARSDLSSAVRTLDNAVSHLDHRIDTLADETKAGFASTAALAGLVPNARANGNTQLAIGTGAYRGSVGGAVGLYHYVNDNVLVNAGFSYAGDKSAIGKAGVTFGW